MGKKGKKNRIGTVYSTDDNYEYEYDDFEEETLPISEQRLEAYIEKKGRGGKSAVVLKGFVGTTDDLNDLCKQIKQKCGVGGSAKDGEIIIQGDNRQKVMAILEKEGYTVKRVGG